MNPLELRGPHDVANLGYIFGLNEQQGKDGVHHNPISVVQAAAGRRLGPYRALIQKTEDLDEHEKSKLPDELSDERDDDSKEDESSGEDSSDSDDTNNMQTE